jgi:hypothetical protein
MSEKEKKRREKWKQQKDIIWRQHLDINNSMTLTKVNMIQIVYRQHYAIWSVNYLTFWFVEFYFFGFTLVI